MSTAINHAKIDDIIKRNISLFNKPGALTVRPGYKLTGGWITDKPAIVVTVDKKLDGLTDDQKLPAEVEDVPVDVREATGLQRLRAKNPSEFTVAMAHIREDQQEPEFPLERSLPGGGPIAPQQNASATLLTSAGAAKTQLTYMPPPGASLSKFTGVTTITACASPDAGYGLLTGFLSQAQSDLTIAMYDFTSGPLLTDVTNLVGPRQLPFKMVLDHPPKNPTADQTDTVTRQTILNSDPNAAINWALTRNDPQVTEWVFPTAYHIKVIVEDGKRFWLSSGNMNNSNEPSTPALQKTGDRDWHVVLENSELAQLYKAFIDNDFNIAAGAQTVGDPTVHAQIKDALQSLSTESSKSTFVQLAMTARTPATTFPAKAFNNVQVSIQPLLTPDKGVHTSMYVDNVLDLINSAKKTLYMQTQYIHPSAKPGDADFMLLVAALSNAHKNGLDVRLITSQYENTAQWIETLKPFDLDQVLRIQNKVHNKGIVVDSNVVMVSSQNWSADGCLRNRDAGLIIENADIAAYFESIFMYDWVNLATEKIVDASTPANT